VRGGLDILKIDKISTDLQCFMFRFGGLEHYLGGAKPIKALPWRHDWFVMYLCEHFLSGTPHA